MPKPRRLLKKLPFQLEGITSTNLVGIAGGNLVPGWLSAEEAINRVGQKGSLRYVWAPVGSRPPMVRDNRHDSAYIFGAICPERRVGAAIITPAVNAECMSLHLEEISAQVTPGSVAAVLCDGAGWHATSGRLRVPSNVALFPLPPYSPELNSMENVWAYLRANKLSSGVWDTYDEIVDACAVAWNWLMDDPDRIGSVGARDWATVNV